MKYLFIIMGLGAGIVIFYLTNWKIGLCILLAIWANNFEMDRRLNNIRKNLLDLIQIYKNQIYKKTLENERERKNNRE